MDKKLDVLGGKVEKRDDQEVLELTPVELECVSGAGVDESEFTGKTGSNGTG